jgi:hypothetical protein
MAALMMQWYGQLDRQGCAVPENGVGCVSTDRPSVESSNIYKTIDSGQQF